MDRVKKTHAKLKKTAKEMASVAREEFEGHGSTSDGVKHQWLYVLKLQEGRWFVGATSRNVESVYKQHQKGSFGGWTRRYKPIKIQNAQYLGNISDAKVQQIEGRMIRKYMEHYGDSNVRGGDASGVSGSIKLFDFIRTRKWTIAPVAVLVIALIFITSGKPETTSADKTYIATPTPTPTATAKSESIIQPHATPPTQPPIYTSPTPCPSPSLTPSPTPNTDYSSNPTPSPQTSGPGSVATPTMEPRTSMPGDTDCIQ